MVCGLVPCKCSCLDPTLITCLLDMVKNKAKIGVTMMFDKYLLTLGPMIWGI
jgi:hypothetical protein